MTAVTQGQTLTRRTAEEIEIQTRDRCCRTNLRSELPDCQSCGRCPRGVCVVDCPSCSTAIACHGPTLRLRRAWLRAAAPARPALLLVVETRLSSGSLSKLIPSALRPEKARQGGREAVLPSGADTQARGRGLKVKRAAFSTEAVRDHEMLQQTSADAGQHCRKSNNRSGRRLPTADCARMLANFASSELMRQALSTYLRQRRASGSLASRIAFQKRFADHERL